MNEWEWRLLEERPPVDRLRIAGADLTRGSRVLLRPRRGGDAQDLLLAGKTAMIESIEQDYDGAVHLAVVLDDDPGRDLGFMRQPGHRFFFAPDDVEPLTGDETGLAPLPPLLSPLSPPPSMSQSACAPRQPEPESDGAASVRTAGGRVVDERAGSAGTPTILVAGIGNIFLGDDAFGVEVARRLIGVDLPDGVRVVDFGIRGLDLVYALLDRPDVTILVDACPRGEAPGTLYVIEPDLAAAPADGSGAGPAFIEPHAMNPMNVIRAAQGMGGELGRILLLGCEPATLGPPEGQLGLSERVGAAVDEAVGMLRMLVRDIQGGHWPRDGQAPA